MGCGGYGGHGRWQDKMECSKMDWMRDRMSGGPWNSAPSSGNRAFDEYRTETLRRLEEEQREFRSFLDRLRFAKDKTEFDQFMAERRDRPDAGCEPAPGLKLSDTATNCEGRPKGRPFAFRRRPVRQVTTP